MNGDEGVDVYKKERKGQEGRWLPRVSRWSKAGEVIHHASFPPALLGSGYCIEVRRKWDLGIYSLSWEKKRWVTEITSPEQAVGEDYTRWYSAKDAQRLSWQRARCACGRRVFFMEGFQGAQQVSGSARCQVRGADSPALSTSPACDRSPSPKHPLIHSYGAVWLPQSASLPTSQTFSLWILAAGHRVFQEAGHGWEDPLQWRKDLKTKQLSPPLLGHPLLNPKLKGCHLMQHRPCYLLDHEAN